MFFVVMHALLQRVRSCLFKLFYGEWYKIGYLRGGNALFTTPYSQICRENCQESCHFSKRAAKHRQIDPVRPSLRPSVRPAFFPSVRPSVRPSFRPSGIPSILPAFRPSVRPAFRHRLLGCHPTPKRSNFNAFKYHVV